MTELDDIDEILSALPAAESSDPSHRALRHQITDMRSKRNAARIEKLEENYDQARADAHRLEGVRLAKDLMKRETPAGGTKASSTDDLKRRGVDVEKWLKVGAIIAGVLTAIGGVVAGVLAKGG